LFVGTISESVAVFDSVDYAAMRGIGSVRAWLTRHERRL